jgi:hypothetical protein
LLHDLLLPDQGGAEKGKVTATSSEVSVLSEVEEAWGILINLELIHADAFIASTILCQ